MGNNNEFKLSPDSKLHRLKDEPEKQHRAFLLWAMQSKTKRNLAAVSRAVSLTHTSIRNYRKQWRWEERTTSITDESEAQQLYRNLYMPRFGHHEISAVQKNIATPLSVGGTVPRSVGESVEKAIQKTSKRPENVQEEEIQRKHVLLLDAAIAYIAQGLKAGDMKRQIRDLPVLMQLRKQLMDKEVSTNAAAIVYESVRVKEAKANGSNVIEAMYEDAEELTIILGALKLNEAHQAIHGEKKEDSDSA